VLWLDVRPTDHWFVYAMDAQAERVVVRPLFVRKDSVAAAVESVSVIARTCAESLLRGEPVVGEALPVPPSLPPSAAAPEARAVAPAEPRVSAPREDRTRFALAYRGESFARDLRWQSGASVSAAFLWAQGPYAGAGFTWFPAHTFGQSVRFSVQRRPLTLLGGFRFHLSRRFDLDAELAATLDIRSRHTQDTPASVAARADQTRVLFSLAPCVRAELAISAWLGLFAAASLDVFFNEFDYLSAPDQRSPELYPYRARPGATVGIAISQ
jgi:hypothetical protein